MMHEKIGPQHLGRKAILYVRQSSLHQVLHNQESRTLQYAMRERLAGLGWSEIETIDVELVERFHNGVTDFGDVLAEIGRILDAQSSRPSARLRSYAFRPSP